MFNIESALGRDTALFSFMLVKSPPCRFICPAPGASFILFFLLFFLPLRVFSLIFYVLGTLCLLPLFIFFIPFFCPWPPPHFLFFLSCSFFFFSPNCLREYLTFAVSNLCITISLSSIFSTFPLSTSYFCSYLICSLYILSFLFFSCSFSFRSINRALGPTENLGKTEARKGKEEIYRRKDIVKKK